MNRIPLPLSLYLRGIALLVAALLPGTAAHAQGSLTPPGPPGPTMKTLAQIEPRTPVSSLPYTINSPGSYYVISNLAGTAGHHGIIIEASDVTLDLGGFVLAGVPGSLNGIQVTSARANLLLRNGTVSNWSIGLDARLGIHCRFESLRVSGNAGNGLMAGTASVMDACTATVNQGFGLTADLSSTVRDCLARANSLGGISVGSGSRVTGCTASSNVGNGIVVAEGSLVTDCLASLNSASGVAAGASAQISRCKATSNGYLGLYAEADAAIQACSVSGNFNSGIVAGARSQVLDCTATVNLNGISVQSGSTVRGCTIQQNSGDGIVVTAHCIVTSNNSSDNFLARTAAGIHASGSGNSIQDNTVIANDWGIRVDAARNLVIKNAASNNSLNYSIGATPQAMGPVLVTDQLAGNTNPSANFEF
jgi:parallel beta-helix repeat protein